MCLGSETQKLPAGRVAVTMRRLNGSMIMPTSFLEIVELPDGSIVLRRAEDEGVLVTLDFSDDAKAFLQGQHVEIAKAMFNIGVQMAGRVSEGDFEREEEGSRVLH
jgi:hypothetical protein|tara:strand:+ start:296 stop:613 length:318 start_codon:yes stop_codon:yes gene_type:complete